MSYLERFSEDIQEGVVIPLANSCAWCLHHRYFEAYEQSRFCNNVIFSCRVCLGMFLLLPVTSSYFQLLFLFFFLFSYFSSWEHLFFLHLARFLFGQTIDLWRWVRVEIWPRKFSRKVSVHRGWWRISETCVITYTCTGLCLTRPRIVNSWVI